MPARLVAGALTVSATFAWRLTVVAPVATLFSVLGSSSVSDTNPVLSTVVPSGISRSVVTVIVSEAVPPTASVPSAHVKVVVPAQDPPVLRVLLFTTTFAGSVSVMETFVAIDGPLLVATKT